MKIKGYDITPKNIKSFIKGNANMLFDLLDDSEKKQVEYRSIICSDCTNLGKCPHCLCDTPNMYFDQSKECKLGKWYSMMETEEFENFIGTMESINQQRQKEGQAKLTINEQAELYSKASIESNKEVKAQTAPQDIEPKPRPINNPAPISLEGHPQVKDFGQVKQGQLLTHTFQIENTTGNDLSVKTVKPGCKCTAANVELGKVLKPGESTAVALSYKTEGIGKFTKSAYVYFNQDIVNPALLILQGKVVNA